MIAPSEEQTRELNEKFIASVRDSIGKHAYGILKNNSKEVLEKGGEYKVVAVLTRLVSNDVMNLGLQIMCPGSVVNTVRDSVMGILENERRRLAVKREEISKAKRHRVCPECGGQMRLSGYHTQKIDCWDCPDCGFWDNTPHKYGGPQ